MQQVGFGVFVVQVGQRQRVAGKHAYGGRETVGQFAPNAKDQVIESVAGIFHAGAFAVNTLTDGDAGRIVEIAAIDEDIFFGNAREGRQRSPGAGGYFQLSFAGAEAQLKRDLQVQHIVAIKGIGGGVEVVGDDDFVAGGGNGGGRQKQGVAAAGRGEVAQEIGPQIVAAVLQGKPGADEQAAADVPLHAAGEESAGAGPKLEGALGEYVVGFKFAVDKL